MNKYVRDYSFWPKASFIVAWGIAPGVDAVRNLWLKAIFILRTRVGDEYGLRPKLDFVRPTCGVATGYDARRPSAKELGSWSRRCGSTLVEMIAVMSVGSVLLVLAASLVHRSMRLDTNWREEADTRRAMSQVSYALRSDLHQATGVEVIQDPLELRITLDDGAVNYAVTEREIIREFKLTSGQPQREFYRKPEEYHVAIERLVSPDRVKLQITRDPQLKDVPPRAVLHVEAEVGRLLRIAGASEVTP